jgi:UDP-N-acetylglucosamine 2-epimerase
VFRKYSTTLLPSKESHIILDIHRPENFNYKDRLFNIIQVADNLEYIFGIPVYLLNFSRTLDKIKQFGINLGRIKVKELMSYKEFLEFQNDSMFIISDSGTAQEEPALMNKPVIVPRDFTERPQSVINHCSYMLDVNFEPSRASIEAVEICNWLEHRESMNASWLGNGDTSNLILNHLKQLL